MDNTIKFNSFHSRKRRCVGSSHLPIISLPPPRHDRDLLLRPLNRQAPNTSWQMVSCKELSDRFLLSLFLSSCPYLEQNYSLPLYLIFVDLKSKEEMIWKLLLLPSSSISTFYRYFWSSTFSTFVNANANGRIWKRYWNNWSIEGFTFRSNKSVQKLLGQNTTLTWNYSNPGVFEKSKL